VASVTATFPYRRSATGVSDQVRIGPQLIGLVPAVAGVDGRQLALRARGWLA
jgi:hypothetical protein